MNLKPIVFIDTEIEPKNGKTLDIGGIKGVGSSFHSNSMVDFAKFLYGSEYVCGYNVFNHDLKYIRNALIYAGLDDTYIIDTSFLSPLLFPAKPYHKLLKDDKLQTEDTNNPLNDSLKAKDLFFDRLVPFAIGSRFGDNTKLLLRPSRIRDVLRSSYSHLFSLTRVAY